MVYHLTGSRPFLALAFTTALSSATLFGFAAQAQQPAAPPPPAATAAPPPPVPAPASDPMGALDHGRRAHGEEMGNHDMGLGRALGLGPDMGTGPLHNLSPEDRAAFLDARIAAVKAALRLTPDQDKLWTPVEGAVRNAITKADEIRKARADKGPITDPIERLGRMAEDTKMRADILQTLVDSARPFYASLTEDQKRRLNIMMHVPGQENWRERVGDRMRAWKEWGKEQLEGPQGAEPRGRDGKERERRGG